MPVLNPYRAAARPGRGWRALGAAALAGSAALATALPFDFVHVGNFQRMTQGGDTSGQIELRALPQGTGHWGLGATAGLQGEIVQLDGRLLISPGSDAQGRTRSPEAQEQALLFAAARVAAWRDIVVPSDLDAAVFEVFLRHQAPGVGLSTEQPFVFRVEGRFPHLLWHVVTGEAPAAGSPGGHGGHGAGHANARSGMRVFRQPGASGQLVGVYSGPALEGVVSHPRERLHIHFADANAAVSGHVDRFSIAAGAVLKLPLH